MSEEREYRFSDLKVGDTFDFDGGECPSFREPCKKSGSHTYVYWDDYNVLRRASVGTVQVSVYHVNKHPSGFPCPPPEYFGRKA